MTRLLPRGSDLDRVKVCPASFALRQARSVPSPAADRGIAVHAFVLSTRRGDGNIADVPDEYRAYCEAINIDQVPEGKYEVELGFDVATSIGRMSEQDLDGENPNEIRGRCDIYREIQVGEQRGVYIGDLKTGLAAHVPRVRDCLQTGFYALAAARAAKVDMAVTEILRVTESGFVERENAVLDGWALDALEVELGDLVRRVREAVAVAAAGGVPQQVTGPHCSFCPALPYCPAQMRLVQLMANAPQDLERDIMTALTPRTAEEAYRKYRMAQDIMGRIRTALYRYAEQHPFEIGNGLVLGPVAVAKNKLDGDVVHQVLAEMFDAGVARRAVKLTTTKRAIRAALRSAVAYGDLMKAEKLVLESTKLRGGVKHGESIQIRAHRPGDDVEVDADE